MLLAVDALFSCPRTKNYQGHQADAYHEPWSGNPSDAGSCDLFCKAIDEVIVAIRLAPQAEARTRTSSIAIVRTAKNG